MPATSLASLAVVPLCGLHDGSAHCMAMHTMSGFAYRTLWHACYFACTAPGSTQISSDHSEPSAAVCLRICRQQQHLHCCCQSPFRFACMLHLTSCYGSLSMWHAHSMSLHGCGVAQWLVRLFCSCNAGHSAHTSVATETQLLHWHSALLLPLLLHVMCAPGGQGR